MSDVSSLAVGLGDELQAVVDRFRREAETGRMSGADVASVRTEFEIIRGAVDAMSSQMCIVLEAADRATVVIDRLGAAPVLDGSVISLQRVEDVSPRVRAALKCIRESGPQTAEALAKAAGWDMPFAAMAIAMLIEDEEIISFTLDDVTTYDIMPVLVSSPSTPHVIPCPVTGGVLEPVSAGEETAHETLDTDRTHEAQIQQLERIYPAEKKIRAWTMTTRMRVHVADVRALLRGWGPMTSTMIIKGLHWKRGSAQARLDAARKAGLVDAKKGGATSAIVYSVPGGRFRYPEVLDALKRLGGKRRTVGEVAVIAGLDVRQTGDELFALQAEGIASTDGAVWYETGTEASPIPIKRGTKTIGKVLEEMVDGARRYRDVDTQYLYLSMTQASETMRARDGHGGW